MNQPVTTCDCEAFRYYRRLQLLYNYVTRHYSEPISLDLAAELTGLSSSYFSRYFQEKTGMNFKWWLSSFRIQKAVKLLQRRDFSVTEVALKVGFQDLGTFERNFKKQLGQTPSAFIKSIAPSRIRPDRFTPELAYAGE